LRRRGINSQLITLFVCRISVGNFVFFFLAQGVRRVGESKEALLALHHSRMME
jgi:hypothetical protein